MIWNCSPTAPKQHLNANIRLVASYQKNARRQFETRNRKGKMKTTTLALILFLTGLDLWAQTQPAIRQTPSRARRATQTRRRSGNAALRTVAPAVQPCPAASLNVPAAATDASRRSGPASTPLQPAPRRRKK